MSVVEKVKRIATLVKYDKEFRKLLTLAVLSLVMLVALVYYFLVSVSPQNIANASTIMCYDEQGNRHIFKQGEFYIQKTKFSIMVVSKKTGQAYVIGYCMPIE